MKIIDIESWERKKAYKWFSAFSNPTYAVTVRLDITEYINFKKANNRNFYADFLYLVVKALNTVPALRQRIEDCGVVEYEAPNPSITVLMPNQTFETCKIPYKQNADDFVKTVREYIDYTQKFGGNKDFNDDKNDVYYFSCLPWLDYVQISDPIPDDIKNASIPRISWGKYVEENERWKITLNVTVNHALVDGKHVSDAINQIQKNINECKSIL
ncbi:MAG: hypothetical protein E7370_03370 [Clostridiales bacterium]|nr:hypothetical protein [Clostridiales bacterium]